VGQAHSQHIYWTDNSGGNLWRANLDGTDASTLVNRQSSPTGIALDSTGGMMYWAAGGHIWQAKLDSTVMPSVLWPENSPSATPLGLYPGVALDTSHGLIYWTDMGSGSHGDIMQANLDGTGKPEPLLTLTGNNLPRGLALDLLGGQAYWTAWNQGDIMVGNLNGTGRVKTLVAGLGLLGYIALDVPNGKMYWANTSGNNIAWAKLDGSVSGTLISNLPNHPYGIVLGQGYIYWTISGSSSGPGEIWRANLDDTGPSPVITGAGVLPTGPIGSPWGIALGP
jgi:hypothetical protein